MAAIYAALVAPSSRKRSPNSLGESQSGGLAASANLTARIVVDDDGGLGALLLAIENDLDSTTSSVAMFLTASFGFLPCLSDTFLFFFFFWMQKLLFSWGLRGLGNGTRPSPSSSGQRSPETRGRQNPDSQVRPGPRRAPKTFMDPREH